MRVRVFCLIEPRNSWTCDLIRGIAESRRAGDDFRWFSGEDFNGVFVDGSPSSRPSDDGEAAGLIVDAHARRRWKEFSSRCGWVVEVFQIHRDEEPFEQRTRCSSCGPAVDRGFDEAAEEMEHLGFHRFAWLHHAGHAASRCSGTPPALAARGAAAYGRQPLETASSAISADPNRGPGADPLARWLQTLAPPVVLFCESAGLAIEAGATCRRLEIVVPDEIAILSAEDDALRCLWADPEMSRMNWVGERVGKATVTLLRDVLELGNPGPPQVLVPPGPAVHRGSTDTLAIADPDVAAAVRYIHEHATEGIRVNDLLRHLPVSRRFLEQKFRATLQRSPAEEIRRVRVLRARELVEGSTLSISEIAHKCGFESCELFSRTFRKWCGMPPTAFRNRRIEGGRIDPAHSPGPAESPVDTPPDGSQASRPILDTS